MPSRCRYTRINGARCAMPTLNGHELCFEHENRKRQARLKPVVPTNTEGPLLNIVYMDDHTSVMANLNAILEAFAHRKIDDRQLSALTRLIQTSLKTLSQRRELEVRVQEKEAIREVTYDEDGSPLAVDPAPAPQPTTLRKVTACAEPHPGSSKPAHFQTLTSKQATNSPAFKHLPKPEKSAPMVSNTYTTAINQSAPPHPAPSTAANRPQMPPTR